MPDSNSYTPNEIREMVIGLNTHVELDNGKTAPAINLDNAATTPALKPVAQSIQEHLLTYGSIGRGLGQKSEYSSMVYENGRKIIMDFVGADINKHSVFYVNSTTEGINKLASALIKNTNDMVLATRMEHHANDLPWRERSHTVYIDVDADGRLMPEDYENILSKYEGRIKFVTVTAASNVTGYVNNVHEIAGIAHKYDAQIIVDGAQIVAHRKFSMKGVTPSQDIDYFVFSAHKMYSPYGGGAVVGLTDTLNERLPSFYGGGMVDEVTDYTAEYSLMPNRFEAGSPNYPGVVGMLKAIEILNSIGFDYIEEHEQRLLRMTLDSLMDIPGIVLYGDNKAISDRVGLVVFNAAGIQNDEVAKKLAGYRGISVRHAKFCAHTYVRRLLKIPFLREAGAACRNYGMVRASFGIYNTEEEVNAFIDTIKLLLNETYPKALLGGVIEMPVTNNRQPNDRG